MTEISSNEFHTVFMMSKTIVFEVSYYTLGSNEEPYYSTSAAQFNRPKSDWSQCGQAQEDLLKGKYPVAYNFYKKWDVKHLQKLSETEYIELISDMEKLFSKYPHMVMQKGDELFSDRGISFWRIKDFSMTVYRNKK